jgi:hypothetical protein
MEKEEKKKKDVEARDKRYEKMDSVHKHWEMSHRLENDDKNVPSERATNVNIIFPMH